MPFDETTKEPACKQAAAMAARAEYMLHYGRANGAIAVKGVMIRCARCGAETEKQHRAHDYCASCVKPAQIERRRAKRAAAGAVTIGSTLICKHCGIEFTKTHKRQFYCPRCSEVAAKDALPAARARANEAQKERNKRLRRTVPAFAIRERMSAGVANSLRDGKNGRSWEAIVGYTITDLMAHLEKQFLKGMTWDNRGEWHIDHITPLASFTFETTEDPEFKAAWALTNLRPLWAADNIRKSAKRLFLI